MIEKQILHQYYVQEKKSMKDIADVLGCSVHKVRYWMEKYKINRRSISEAVYVQHNPNGDPFTIKEPTTLEESRLVGLGLALYWGEGTKSNTVSVRLGNADPALIKMFIKFLVDICGIDTKDLKFGLQIFSDINQEEALQFWMDQLNVSKNQFQKVVVTQSGKRGTYRRKLRRGVVTVYYYNKKLRDWLCRQLEMLGSQDIVYKEYRSQ